MNKLHKLDFTPFNYSVTKVYYGYVWPTLLMELQPQVGDMGIPSCSLGLGPMTI